MIKDNEEGVLSVGELIKELKNFDDNTPVVIMHMGIHNFKIVEGYPIGKKTCVWLRVPVFPADPVDE